MDHSRKQSIDSVYFYRDLLLVLHHLGSLESTSLTSEDQLYSLGSCHILGFASGPVLQPIKHKNTIYTSQACRYSILPQALVCCRNDMGKSHFMYISLINLIQFLGTVFYSLHFPGDFFSIFSFGRRKCYKPCSCSLDPFSR